MPSITFKEAQRRYQKAFAPVMVFYVIFCFAGPMLLNAMIEPPLWVVSLVAIITALPIAGVFLLVVRLLRETDEYTRKVQTDAMLTGGAITLSLTTMWAFLELFDVAPKHEDFSFMLLVTPLFFGMWGLVYLFQARQSK